MEGNFQSSIFEKLYGIRQFQVTVFKGDPNLKLPNELKGLTKRLSLFLCTYINDYTYIYTQSETLKIYIPITLLFHSGFTE